MHFNCLNLSGGNTLQGYQPALPQAAGPEIAGLIPPYQTTRTACYCRHALQQSTHTIII